MTYKIHLLLICNKDFLHGACPTQPFEVGVFCEQSGYNNVASMAYRQVINLENEINKFLFEITMSIKREMFSISAMYLLTRNWNARKFHPRNISTSLLGTTTISYIPQLTHLY